MPPSVTLSSYLSDEVSVLKAKSVAMAHAFELVFHPGAKASGVLGFSLILLSIVANSACECVLLRYALTSVYPQGGALCHRQTRIGAGHYDHC